LQLDDFQKWLTVFENANGFQNTADGFQIMKTFAENMKTFDVFRGLALFFD